jgi:hypothetical protein
VGGLSDRLAAVLAIGFNQNVELKNATGMAPAGGNIYNDFGDFTKYPFPEGLLTMSHQTRVVHTDIIAKVKFDERKSVFASTRTNKYGTTPPFLSLPYNSNQDAAWWLLQLTAQDQRYDPYSKEDFFFLSTSAPDIEYQVNQTFRLQEEFVNFVGMKRNEDVSMFAFRLMVVSIAVRRDIALPVVAAFHKTQKVDEMEIIGIPKKSSTLIFKSSSRTLYDVIKTAVEFRSDRAYTGIVNSMLGLLDRLRDGGIWMGTGLFLEDIFAVSIPDNGTPYKLYLYDLNPKTTRVWDNNVHFGTPEVVVDAGPQQTQNRIKNCSVLLHMLLLVGDIVHTFGDEANDLIDRLKTELKERNYDNSCFAALSNFAERLDHRTQTSSNFLALIANEINTILDDKFKAIGEINEYDIYNDLREFVQKTLTTENIQKSSKRQRLAM